MSIFYTPFLRELEKKIQNCQIELKARFYLAVRLSMMGDTFEEIKKFHSKLFLVKVELLCSLTLTTLL